MLHTGRDGVKLTSLPLARKVPQPIGPSYSPFEVAQTGQLSPSIALERVKA